jgi:hypothetical protein
VVEVRKAAAAVMPSNMKGQDLSRPADSYTRAKSTTLRAQCLFILSTAWMEVVDTLSSSAGAGAALVLLPLLLYIWFEGGSVGWLDDAVSDNPVLTCPSREREDFRRVGS